MKSTLPWFHPKRLGSLIVIEAMLAQMVMPAHAVSTGYTGTVSQLPGGFITPPDSNVMFTLDDSGSMYSDSIPDLIADNVDLTDVPGNADSNALGSDNQLWPALWTANSDYFNAAFFANSGTNSKGRIGRYLRSSAGNPLYYDPTTLYQPWPTASDDKTLMPNADVKKVNIHPTDPTNNGYTIDLTAQQGNPVFWPATYFTTTATLPFGDPNSAASKNATFVKVEIKSTVASYAKSKDRSDCTGAIGATGCSYAQELQNFANWLQYYRSRMLMAKGGVATAFAKQGSNLRVGFGTINSPASLGVKSFTTTVRPAFYTAVYGAGSTNGTPLREAMDKVGQYFQRSNVGNPWAEDPSSTAIGKEYSCRRSFHILSTDGFWNGNGASGSAANNNDLFSGSTPTPAKGSASTYDNAASSKFGIYPFADNNAGTLADVAAYYWKTDLRGDLINDVAGSTRDPAFWQHLSTFTVGLGITGTGVVTQTVGTVTTTADLTTQASRDLLITNHTQLNWTTPSADAATTGDDLIHASMSGRGRYFSATDPVTLSTGLASALAEAADSVGDFASVAADSPQLSANGNIYQATFSPARWYGRLYSFTQSAAGVVNNKPTDSSYTNTSQVWEASNKMLAPASRNIFTSSGTANSGASFTWTGGLTTAQKGLLGDNEDILNYLRGDGSLEVSNNGTFRDRARYKVGTVTGGVLGDIVNATPLKGPDAGGGYERLPSADSAQGLYAAYRSGTGLDAMRNTIFLGANDGMLHSFNLTDGVERFAYVPNAVYEVPRSTTGAEKKLQLLATDLTNTHRFTVDGPPNISDAFIGGAWKTVLTASNGAGARGVYALDVSNPAVGTTGGFGTSKILWEFTEANNTGVGYVISYPHVVRMADSNKTWAVIFGNGYDSVGGRAKLFILRLSDGSVMAEIGVGAAGDNGLSQPNFVLNSNREVTAIYAGDLKGNLWKFDVSDPDYLKWAPAFGSLPNYSPLFTAISSGGVAQPISVMPEITAHPQGGAVVSFGTGKLFENSDTALATSNPANVNLKATQSIYGIWDKPSETTGISITASTRSTILQSHTSATFATGATYGATGAETPSSTQRGWFIDLDTGGERVNLTAQQVRSVLFVVANTPVSDPCSSGGKSKIFALNPITGARPNFAVFDVNGDGLFKNVDDGGFNVKLGTGGLLTQPLFQFTGTGGAVVTGTVTGLDANISTALPSAVDRGQATAARQGGVELGRNPTGTCDFLLTAAQTDTSILTQYIKTCLGKARISWRQLK